MGMARALATECGDDGITVNAVCLAWWRRRLPWLRSWKEAFNRVMINQCIKKRVTPQRFAALAAFIVSDDAEMITGRMILCDLGGYLH